jgi:hypothetical protein
VAVGALLATLLAGCATLDPGDPDGGQPMPPWAWAMPQCVVYQPAAYEAPAHRRSATVHEGAMVSEHVEVYEPGWGARAVDDIRAVVAACASYEYGELGDPAGFREQHRVIATGLAGDESLLVETVRLAPPEVDTWYTVVARYGDQVITLRTRDLTAEATRCLVATDPATCPTAQA